MEHHGDPEYDPLASKSLWIIATVSFALLLLAFWLPIQDVIIHFIMRMGWDRFLQHTTVPYELHFISVLLTFFGFHIKTGNEYITWQYALGKNEFIFFTWNCGGWQSFLLFFVSTITGLRGKYTLFSKWETFILGIIGTYLFTMIRLMAVLVIYILVGRPLGLVFHDYLTIFLTFGWLIFFWWFAQRFLLREKQNNFFPRLAIGRGAVAVVTIIALLANYLAFFTRVPVAHAASNPTIEQQINIFDGNMITGGASDGIVLIDTANYTGATVSYYFEVVAKTTVNGTVTLTFNAGTGSTVSGGSTVASPTISGSTYTRYRSSAFTPSGAQNAYVSNIGSGINVQSARIIIVQSDSTSINNSVSQIEIGDNETGGAGQTVDSVLLNPKYWKWDSTKYDGTVSVFFEATIWNSGTKKTNAKIYQSGSSCSTPVGGIGALQASGSTPSRLRSADISGGLTSGNTYMVCTSVSTATGATTAQIANAHIIVQQTSSNGLTKMEIYHTQANTLTSASATTLTGQNFFNKYEAGNWVTGTQTYYFEATTKIGNSGDTDTGQICYQASSACDTTVGNSISITSTTLSLLRSTSFSGAPTDGKDLDTGLKVSTSGHTVNANHSALVIDVTSLQTPENVLPLFPLAIFLPKFVEYYKKRKRKLINAPY